MHFSKQLVLSLVAIILYGILLHTSIPTSSGSLPPLGKFLNPFTGFWQNAENTAPEDQVLDGLPLEKEVEIIFDDRLVPHVFAQNDSDLAFAQGYLHAYHRLWQMDISARQAAGRLAEVFGEGLLKLDLNMYRMGVPKAAAQYAVSWQDCETFPILESYIAGANQYIDQLGPGDFPLEYKLFNYAPERWSPYHAALIMMSMNIALCSRNEDLAATATLDLLGKEDFDFLFPPINPKQSPVIPSEVKYEFGNSFHEVMERDETIGSLPYNFMNVTDPHVGSNNWAISGDRTASSFPILCNDPHLNLTLPSIWYEIQLHGNTHNSYGVSLPGVPNIVIGFNEEIAWGATNVGMDVSDLIRIRWLDSSKGIYIVGNEEKRVEVRIDTIYVKGEEPVIDTVRYTDWGPLYIDDSISLALHWLPLINAENDCAMRAFATLNKATNIEEYRQAISWLQNPPQNFAFASNQGDIALKVQGRLPARSGAAGRFAPHGDHPSNEWLGFIPSDQNPIAVNPKRGFVSSANQRSTDTTYPYHYHGYFDDYRGRVLNEFLAESENVDIDDMKAMQLSTYSLLASELCPLLLDLLDGTGMMDETWYQRLASWDYKYEPHALAPIFFAKWHESLQELIWDELEQSDLVEYLTPESWRLIDMLEHDPTHKFFDMIQTPEEEDAHELTQISFARTKAYCDSLFHENPSIDWSSFKQVRINHLSRIPAFSSQVIPAGGTATALNSIKKTHGPSWRMIVELGDQPTAWGIYPGGQSGNPGSPYYNNMVDDWALGKYYPLILADHPAALSQHKLGRIYLVP